MAYSKYGIEQVRPNPHLTSAMPDSKIRALCAQIALEIDAQKADALVGKLKRLFNGEIVPSEPEREETLPQESSAARMP